MIKTGRVDGNQLKLSYIRSLGEISPEEALLRLQRDGYEVREGAETELQSPDAEGYYLTKAQFEHMKHLASSKGKLPEGLEIIE